MKLNIKIIITIRFEWLLIEPLRNWNPEYPSSPENENAFNRTFKELKLKWSACSVLKCILLIEPLRNWNKRLFALIKRSDSFNRTFKELKL